LYQTDDDSRYTALLGAGMVICLERVADLHMAQLMPLPLAVACFSKIQIGFTFLVPAHPVVQLFFKHLKMKDFSGL